MKANSKKSGFTLTELLIVVAIIAVLSAIAAPLFIGRLNEAKKAVEKANVRAARSYAITEILTRQDIYGLSDTEYGWLVNVIVTETGEIRDPLISPCSNEEEWKNLVEMYDSFGGYYCTEDGSTGLPSVSFLLSLLEVEAPDTASP